MRLSLNAFTGQLAPNTVGSLSPTLDLLNLDGNSLSGVLPDDLSNLVAWTGLFLGNNFFDGQLPTILGQLTLLSQLSLYDNSFRNSLPEELGNLDALVLLDLGSNLMSGSIPEALSGLVSSESLFLEDNHWTGLRLLLSVSLMISLQQAVKGK